MTSKQLTRSRKTPAAEPRIPEVGPAHEQNESANLALAAVRARLIFCLRAVTSAIPAAIMRHRACPLQSGHSSLREEFNDLTHSTHHVDWLLLLKDTEKYAKKRIRRLCWRGEKGGVMPDGYDASGVAAEAVTELLQDIQSQTPSPAPHGHSLAHQKNSLAPFSTYDQELHHRCNPWPAPSSFSPLPSVQMSPSGDGHGEGSSVSPTQDQTLNPELFTFAQLRQELRQRVCKIVNRLRHRKENRLLRNDADLAPVIIDDDESIGVLESIPAPDATPLEALISKEQEGEFERLKKRFKAFLGHDRRLINVFACLCAEISKPMALGRKLKRTVREVENDLKRLRRKWVEFSGREPPRR